MNVRAIALALPVALAAGTACSHTQQGSSTGAMGEPAERQAAGNGAGSQAAGPQSQDPIIQPGPAVQGHAGDQIVSGRIASAGGDAISIETTQGETRTLQIAPETWVELDGQEASAEDLAEGVPVRASYDEVEGQPVAVKVFAGESASGARDVQGTGASQQPEPGATNPGPGGAEAAPDAGWGPPPGDGAGGPGR